MSKRARPNPEEGDVHEDTPEYFYQRHYQCGHTISRFGWYNPELYNQFKAGRMPSVHLPTFCSDCKSRRELEGNDLNIHTNMLRGQINNYVVKLDDFSRRMNQQECELERLRAKSAKDDAELKKLRQASEYQPGDINLQVFSQGMYRVDKEAEVKKLAALVKANEAEVEKQKSVVYRQGMELGDLRKKVKDFEEFNGGYIIDGVLAPHPPPKQPLQIQNTTIQNPNMQLLRSNGVLAPSVQNPNLQPLGSPTKNPLPVQTPNQQDTIKEKKLKLIATMGYINPIASGFSSLKHGLREHKWDPFIKSLFAELGEAVRRNDWEEIRAVHEKTHSFAKTFDNDFRERIEKAEEEIIKQCEEGVQRLLGAMFVQTREVERYAKVNNSRFFQHRPVSRDYWTREHRCHFILPLRTSIATIPQPHPFVDRLRKDHHLTSAFIAMPPSCTTTGTTWETCGHSIYQHQPWCKHPGNCTKNSLLQQGTCPSCTQIDYYPTAEPPVLPSHLRANGSNSESKTAVKIKKEPEDDKENMALVKKETPMLPDDYLKSEYEKHKKELAEQSGNMNMSKGEAGGSALFGRAMENKGESSGTLGSGLFGTAAKEEKNGKEYFLELQIKQLEEKLEAARLREVEKSVKIGNLQAQVVMLRDTPTQRGYASGSSTVTRSSEFQSPNFARITGSGPYAENALPTAKPFIDVRESIKGNRENANKGSQVGHWPDMRAQNGGPINDGQHASQSKASLPNQGPRPQVVKNGKPETVPPPKQGQTPTLPRDEKSAPKQAFNALEGPVFRHQADEYLNGPVTQAAGGAPDLATPVQHSNTNANTQLQPYVESQVSAQAPADGAQIGAPQPQAPSAAEEAIKKQLFDVAAISFSSQLTIKLLTLKDAVKMDHLDEWFDKQVKHNFKCAQELNFSKLVDGYRNFVDWIGNNINVEEEDINSALKDCESMVQVLIDVEAILSG
ncbi:hypothetical protein L207DRAFT_527871 [Hyaloscypha variabilis F]|uniref:Uncharacterized protein n=1 Tax=Hyaloscypha variabilis (strain UAMH 11265 / GT02V1 / F) TaxID=1149755 RepID=A0A2J6RRU6_HYAVF|nr:hypothetical protein L207DRAFT_527871 [Hyaloscypha variabilis F]